MKPLVKISELAARAGVSKSTVQHYVREGLLPAAKKTHRNMAWYRPELVDRIRLIRELQQRRNLPLATIKRLLKDPRSIAEIRAFVQAQPAPLRSGASASVDQDRIIAETGLSIADLEKLESLGIVSPSRRPGGIRYDANDVAILHAIASMRQAGLNPDRGFHAEDLAFYMEAMRKLVAEEIRVFTRSLDFSDAGEVLKLARAGLEGTNLLLMALRRKVILELIETDEGGRRA